jgi:hypothetical protein
MCEIPTRIRRISGGGRVVLFVQEMKLRLLSVSTLEDEGYGVVFEDGHVFISRGIYTGRNNSAWCQTREVIQVAGTYAAGEQTPLLLKGAFFASTLPRGKKRSLP